MRGTRTGPRATVVPSASLLAEVKRRHAEGDEHQPATIAPCSEIELNDASPTQSLISESADELLGRRREAGYNH